MLPSPNDKQGVKYAVIHREGHLRVYYESQYAAVRATVAAAHRRLADSEELAIDRYNIIPNDGQVHYLTE